jgi:predicted transcriptional regulator
MARPRTYTERRIATAVRLPESVHRRLHEAAADRDISANLLVTRAVAEFLDRLPSAESTLGRGVPRVRSPKMGVTS